MKKAILSALFCGVFAANVTAQVDIQLHYDMGRALYKSLDARPWVTTTVEMFKADKWGNTYFFVDMDYTDKGVDCAYWEISRELQFWKAPFAAHVEYNGGLNYINNAFLGGAAYNWHNDSFSRLFGMQMLYKYIQKNSSPHNFQLTATWTLHFDKGRYTFCGFADFWREKHQDLEGNMHDFIFNSEPQFWVNLNKFKHVNEDFNLSVGTECELSANFATRKGFYCIPTLALKWTLN